MSVTGWILVAALGLGSTLPADAPGGAEWEARARELIAQLEADAYAVREAATASLIELGPEILDLLSESLDEGGPELVGRARYVMQQIARRWKYLSAEAGPVTGGFQAKLSADRAAFAAGKPVVLTVELRNVSDRPRRLARMRAVDLEVSGSRFVSPESDGLLSIVRIGAGKAVAQGRPIVLHEGPPHLIEFRNGGPISTLLSLEGCVELEAGHYEAHFTYYARTRKLLEGASRDLKSNTVRFQVQ